MKAITWRQAAALVALLAALVLALVRPPAGSDGMPPAVEGECAPVLPAPGPASGGQR